MARWPADHTIEYFFFGGKGGCVGHAGRGHAGAVVTVDAGY